MFLSPVVLAAHVSWSPVDRTIYFSFLRLKKPPFKLNVSLWRTLLTGTTVIVSFWLYATYPRSLLVVGNLSVCNPTCTRSHVQ